jgi:hypothetical protein
MNADPGLIAKLAMVSGLAARGLSVGWRLALLEHYIAIPGRGKRVRQLLAGSGRHLLVACMPKSGSTFFSAALAHATGFSFETLGWGYEQNEQDLYPPALVRKFRENTVTQQHMRASDPNLRLIEAFSITPIVLVRSLPDIVVSIFDHMAHDSQKTPMAYVDDGYSRLDKSAQIDFIVELFMPWYVSFYVSWQEAERTGKCRPLWVRYEEMTADPVSTITAVLESCNTPRSKAEIAAAVERALGGKVRFNKGVPGRGNALLSEAQRGRISSLTRHYPGIDFSPVIPGAGKA